MDGNSQGAIVRTVSWFLVSIAGLGVVARSGIKAGVIRRFGSDDVFIGLAFLFFVGQVVCLHLEIELGLGVGEVQDVSKLLKLDWASDLLFMPVYGFAKLSVVSLLRKFTLGKRDRRILYIFEWLLALWALSSEIVWSFECALPAPWDYLKGRCINRTIWVVLFESCNIVTDLLLVIMPAMVILSLKAPLKRRLTSASFFIARICILPASAARIYYWIVETNTPGLTEDIFNYVVVTVVVCALEILAGCILYLQPLFDTLESGFMWGGDLRRRGQTFDPALDFSAHGSLPFTRMRIPHEDLLTGQQTAYSVRAEGPEQSDSFDEEKEIEVPLATPPQVIQMNQTFDVHTSPDPQNRTTALDTKVEAAAILSDQKKTETTLKRKEQTPHEREPATEFNNADAQGDSAGAKRDSARSSRSVGDVLLPFMGIKRNSTARRDVNETGPDTKKRKSTPQIDVAIPRSSLYVTMPSQRTSTAAIAGEGIDKELPSLPPTASPVEMLDKSMTSGNGRSKADQQHKPSHGW